MSPSIRRFWATKRLGAALDAVPPRARPPSGIPGQGARLEPGRVRCDSGPLPKWDNPLIRSDGEAYSEVSRLRSAATYLIPPVVTIALLILLIQISLPAMHIPAIFVPLPSSVLLLLASPHIPWLQHSEITLYEAVTGFLLATAFGIPVAILMHFSRPLRMVFSPIILAAQVAPKIALVPVLFLWLGFAPLPRILTVFLVCFFPVVVDTETGLASVEPDMVELVRSFNSSTIDLIRKVSFPTALPSIFSGLKVSITLAMVGAVVAEFVQSSSGLGYLILSAQANLNTALAFAAVTILVALSLVLYVAIILVEWAVVPWRR